MSDLQLVGAASGGLGGDPDLVGRHVPHLLREERCKRTHRHRNMSPYMFFPSWLGQPASACTARLLEAAAAAVSPPPLRQRTGGSGSDVKQRVSVCAF